MIYTIIYIYTHILYVICLYNIIYLDNNYTLILIHSDPEDRVKYETEICLCVAHIFHNLSIITFSLLHLGKAGLIAIQVRNRDLIPKLSAVATEQFQRRSCGESLVGPNILKIQDVVGNLKSSPKLSLS